MLKEFTEQNLRRLWCGFGVALVWLSVGYQLALCGFGWLARRLRQPHAQVVVVQ
jgi:hypothetical protein